jgi:hypothetical protein
MADSVGTTRQELAALRDSLAKSPLAWLALLRFDYLQAKLHRANDVTAWQQLAAEYSRRGPAIPKELRRSEEMFALDVDEARCKM